MNTAEIRQAIDYDVNPRMNTEVENDAGYHISV